MQVNSFNDQAFGNAKREIPMAGKESVNVENLQYKAVILSLFKFALFIGWVLSGGSMLCVAVFAHKILLLCIKIERIDLCSIRSDAVLLFCCDCGN